MWNEAGAEHFSPKGVSFSIYKILPLVANCCQFAWTGGDKILCFGVLWHPLSVGCGEGPFQGAQRGWLEWLVLSVLEAEGSYLRKQLGHVSQLFSARLE